MAYKQSAILVPVSKPCCKRQHKKLFTELATRSNELLLHYTLTVSYTHLDVYKRQLLYEAIS